MDKIKKGLGRGLSSLIGETKIEVHDATKGIFDHLVKGGRYEILLADGPSAKSSKTEDGGYALNEDYFNDDVSTPAAEPEEEKDNDYSDTDEDEVRVCVCQSTVEGREGQELPLLIIAHQISLDLYIPNPEYINVLATTSNVHTNTRDVKDEMGEMEEFVPIMKPKGRKTSVMAGVVTVEAGRNNRT